MELITTIEKLDWGKFAEMFHPSWERKIRPFIESKECFHVYQQIREQSVRGKRIVPAPVQTYRVFKETNLEEIKAAFFGLSPYHTLKDGKILADGICMSAKNTMSIPPSLEQFYGGMERELFPDSETGVIRNPDLAYLCNQGVFMSNISLTCELLKAGSHIKIWEPFTKYLLEEIIAPTNIPICWLGKEAVRFDRYVNPFQWRFPVSHPASASYNHTQWSSEGVFNKMNKVMKDYNGYSVAWAPLLPF